MTLNRRQTMVLAAAVVMAPGLPAWAQPRTNPMPEDLRRDLERDPAVPVLGNSEGDITLTEFFDYNCGFCRKMVRTVQALIEADPKLRVVFREWPIFGEGSDFAARAALASLPQGKYWQMHAGLMTLRGRAEEASVLRVAGDVGVDLARLRRDMDSDAIAGQISRTGMLADHMGLNGTPMFIAGDEAAFGFMDLADLQELVARGRRALGVTG